MPTDKVLLGMSGGADSSMAAILLKESGYNVIGATLNTYLPQYEDQSIEEARQICQSIGIPHLVLKARSAFKKEVIDYFTRAYLSGATPNPCIRCNNTIKWKYLMEAAQKKGCKHVATGHYASVVWHQSRYYLRKALDQSKDQSYFLWNLTQEVLSRALFPLGHYQKKEIKELAVAYGLPHLAKKSESMGICFLKNEDYRTFLMRQIPASHPSITPGNVVDGQGRKMGTHHGFALYTPGQKRGIEPPLPQGWCVAQIVPDRNELVAEPSNTLHIQQWLLPDFELTPDETLWKDQEVTIRIRGLDRVAGYKGTLCQTPQGLLVHFREPVWAVTPGQSMVFYQEDLLIGGAEIQSP